MDRISSKYLVALFLFVSVLMLAMIQPRKHASAFHSMEEWDTFVSERLMHAPPDTNHLFPTANRCKGCHGFDPQMNAMVDWMGNDVNFHDDWSTSMMANSAKDPFWRAKVSHEILANPSHQLDLETKCTSCHAPQGHFTAILRGAENYSIAEMEKDTIAMDGVSCGACHMKSEENLDKLFSGAANYDTSFVMYGPHVEPFAAPMNDFVGFNPIYSEHINDAGICASCHTLTTSSVDLEGNYTGRSFVEQATYHEWINSDFDDEGLSPRTCQSCHMPRLEESVVISANYLFLEPRSPYALHDMVGANTTMIDLIKNNKEELNIEAADEHFDETIAKTLNMLQKQSISTELTHTAIENDSIFFDLKIINKAGHKFPSGYPSRRVWVEFVLESEDGEVLFASGVPDENFEILQPDELIEPHHEIISSESEVQVYEFIIGDVNEEITTVLERADKALKDNRLPPRGFSTLHAVYDTTRIYGAALDDPNFNMKQDGQEGSGQDVVRYHIPLKGYEGYVNVKSKIYYQTIAPRWLVPMFELESEEISSFKSMYENADVTPVVIAEDSIPNILIESLTTEIERENLVRVFPNPSQDGIVYIQSTERIESIKVLNAQGQVISVIKNPDNQLSLPKEKGLYLLEILVKGQKTIEKVVVQ